MSNYGADPSPNIEKINNVSHGYRMVSELFTQSDQFTIDANNVVYKFNTKSGRNRLKILANPNEISG